MKDNPRELAIVPMLALLLASTFAINSASGKVLETVTPRYTITIPAASAKRAHVRCDVDGVSATRLTMAFLYRVAPGLSPTVDAYRIVPSVRSRPDGARLKHRLEPNPDGNTNRYVNGPGTVSLDELRAWLNDPELATLCPSIPVASLIESESKRVRQAPATAHRSPQYSRPDR